MYRAIVTKMPLFGKLGGEAAKLLYIGALFLLVALGAFGLGRLSALSGGQGPRVYAPQGFSALPEVQSAPRTAAQPIVAVGSSLKTGAYATGSTSSMGKTTGAFVASKNGSKYYAAHCSGVSRIKETNRVWFESVAEAEAAGYTLASGCAAQ